MQAGGWVETGGGGCCHLSRGNLFLGQSKPPTTIDFPKAVVLDWGQAVVGSDSLSTVECSGQGTREDHVDSLVLEEIRCCLHKSDLRAILG